MALQIQIMPYARAVDNYMALSCSISLTVLLLCSIFYKYLRLTELPDMQVRMSNEQIDDFGIDALALSVLFVASVLGSLVLSAVLFLLAIANEQVARRLRFKESHKAVTLPMATPDAFNHQDGERKFKSDAFHLFLSHAWPFGQDVMNLVKRRCREALPDIQVFLE